MAEDDGRGGKGGGPAPVEGRFEAVASPGEECNGCGGRGGTGGGEVMVAGSPRGGLLCGGMGGGTGGADLCFSGFRSSAAGLANEDVGGSGGMAGVAGVAGVVAALAVALAAVDSGCDGGCDVFAGS